MQALRLPAINDVTTDTENPPAFSRSRAVLEARGGHIPPDVPAEFREAQREAYARIAPLTLDLPPDEAFELVKKAAAKRGWQVIEAVRPGGRVLMLALAVVNLLVLPFGTALGVYALWVLLNNEGRRLFEPAR